MAQRVLHTFHVSPGRTCIMGYIELYRDNGKMETTIVYWGNIGVHTWRFMGHTNFL